MKTKRLNLTINCTAVYTTGIDVPEDMSFEEAIEYAKTRLEGIPVGVLEYFGNDVIDEDNCDFDE